MADSAVPITAGTGTNIDTFTQADGSHRQAVVVGDPNTAAVAGVSADNKLVVETPFKALFTDTFEGGIDAVNRWTTAGTVAPTASTGALAVNPGTTASATSASVSRPVFPQLLSAYMALSTVIRLPAAAETNNTKFWGFGTVGTPSATVPVTNGVGFELTNGVLSGAVYSNSAEVQTVALTRPTDGGWHRYVVYFRTSRAFFENDGVNVGSIAFPVPNVTSLPITIVSANAAATSTNALIESSVIGVADTSGNHEAIADGAYPWRKSSITDPATIQNALLPGARELSVGNALNVNSNAIQKATYRYTANRGNAAAMTANTIQWAASLHHLAAATRTVRLRRVIVTAAVSATTESMRAELHWVATAPTGTNVAAGAGTATTGYKPMDLRDPNAEATATNTLTAVTSTGLIASVFVAASNTAALHGGGAVLYDWQESGETKPITLRAGVLEGVAVGFVSSSTPSPTVTVEFVFTEE